MNFLINSARATIVLLDTMRRMRNAERAWRVISVRMKQQILVNFRMGGVYPEKWTQSRAAAARGGQTLVHRAHLRNSVMSRAGANFAAAGPQNIIYARIHQFGGKTGRGHRVTLPARPYLPIKDGRLSDADDAYVKNVLRNWLIDGRPSPT